MRKSSAESDPLEIEVANAASDLAEGIRKAGFASGPPETLDTCHATLFTESVSTGGRKRKSVKLEFRIVLLGEQVPRLCSSAHGESENRVDAVLAALADEVRQIRDAQPKGMAFYAGAFE